MSCKTSARALPLLLGILLTELAAEAQLAAGDGSWLDRPLVNWNDRAGAVPAIPRPSTPVKQSDLERYCRKEVRQPVTGSEKAVAGAGWLLYDVPRSSGPTRVFMAMASVDGMCRPMSYQAFVFAEGRYSGTLAPAPMDSRTDGSLVSIRLTSPTHIVAEFVRYQEPDPLCCPSKVSVVEYELRSGAGSSLIPIDVKTRPTTEGSGNARTGSSPASTPLSGKRWVLVQMGDQPQSGEKRNLAFDEQQRRVFGDAGCNRFSGSFEANGTSLKLSRLLSTKMACADEDANRLETRFLEALEHVTRFEVRGTTLRLYSGQDRVLVFESR